MTQLDMKKTETYDYGVRNALGGNIICMSFDRSLMEKRADEWNARNDGSRYVVVQRLRVLFVTDWHSDPLDTLV